MVSEHVPVGSRCTIIFEKSLGMRKHSWCMQFRGRSIDEKNCDTTFEGIGVKVQVWLMPRLHEDDVKTKRKVCGWYPIRSSSDKAIGACLHEDDAGTFKDAFVWSDDEVELLLSRVDDYKTSTSVDWDTVRLKHIVIRQVFPNVSKNVHQPVINPLFSIRNISQKENEKKIDT